MHFAEHIFVNFFVAPLRFFIVLVLWNHKLLIWISCVFSDMVCPHPHVPGGSRTGGFRSVYKSGNTVMIACNPGLRLIGESFITCGSDGKWKPRLPQCEQWNRQIFNWNTHTHTASRLRHNEALFLSLHFIKMSRTLFNMYSRVCIVIKVLYVKMKLFLEFITFYI